MQLHLAFDARLVQVLGGQGRDGLAAVARLHGLLAFLAGFGGIVLLIVLILLLLDAALQIAGGLVLVFVHAGLLVNEGPVSARHPHQTVRSLTEWRKRA
ncbi:hypothetical protein D3C81_1358400 [compost metagenome]